ncbi:TPM domain-containing protein [bacterium SCSIO 12643]|nr:TPM domain-containing protein [bacterium SCSIO 12643]
MQLKKYIQILSFVLPGVFLSLNGWSQNDTVIPDSPNPPSLVVDWGEVFSDREEAYLKRELNAFNDTTSNQILIVTLKDLKGLDPYEMATGIGHKWGVGQGEFDNGVVILIKPKTADSRGEVFIAIGYGLEGAIPDATTKLIVENDMIPYFKQGRMFEGVESGLQVVKALAVGEYSSDAYANRGGSGGFSFFPFLLLIVVIIISMVSRARAARSYSVGHDIPFWTALMLMNQSRGHRGHYDNFTSGGGGFGGFGGFGGGGFGGGGAGGSW